MSIIQKLKLGFRIVRLRTKSLLIQPIFLILALFDALCVLIGTLGLFALEYGVNPKINTLLDTFWWSIATVTTVGYGEIIPVTPWGKLFGIFMMVLGTVMFWSFTAFFAGALISAEIGDVEQEMKTIEEEVKLDEKTLHRLITQVESALNDLKSAIKKMPP